MVFSAFALVTIPSIFIVGAPRCGTTSLHAYLSSHPQVFMSNPKEPHHFGSDLPLRIRPYADLQQYLQLFDAAGDRRAGEASVGYLYSKTAPQEILAASPDARIIIMLRDPVDLVCSLHSHLLWGGYEDLPDLEQALAAEDDRRQGRRIPRICATPMMLQYTFVGRYTEHVRRYLDVFGPERVKCVLLEDLTARPEQTYRETLDFLGLEPLGSPDFKAHNPRLQWRSRLVARIVLPALYSPALVRIVTPNSFLGRSARLLAGLLLYLPVKLNITKGTPPPVSPELKQRLREGFRDDVEQLASLLGRDLSPWISGARAATS